MQLGNVPRGNAPAVMSSASAAGNHPRENLSAILRDTRCHRIGSMVHRGGGDQAYSRLSTTHGHITDCQLDSVVYAGACEVI